ncbi:MAG: DUF1150 domain-containing protein [Alphaproteobacteria bacterium]|nr:DUF1150 domain-containing protein [Alphaproteobacteria bacterium]
MHTENQIWSRLSARDFAALGLNEVAYITKLLDEAGNSAFVVRAANGQEIGTMSKRDIAVAAVRQHDMEPLSVH